MSNVSVHQNHCCKLHGCKYGDENCPVVDGTANQAYPCEDCTEVKEQVQELKSHVDSLELSLNMVHNKSKASTTVLSAVEEIKKQIQILEIEIKKQP